jgi:hypothetical protein
MPDVWKQPKYAPSPLARHLYPASTMRGRGSCVHKICLFRALAALIGTGLLLVGPIAHADEGTSSPPPSPTAESAAVRRHGSVFVDPLGFLLFGPTAGVEAGAGHVTGIVSGRWLNAGLLARHIFPGNGESFAFSYGVGLRGRYYLAAGFSRVHLGLGMELIHSRVEDPANLVATNSLYGVPMAEAGYRWALGSVYVGAAAAAGYAFRLSANVEDLPGGNQAARFAASDESTVYGSASLELGVYF